MSNIVEFVPGKTKSHPARRDMRPCEVVIFPGVRMERIDTGDADAARRPGARKPH